MSRRQYYSCLAFVVFLLPGYLLGQEVSKPALPDLPSVQFRGRSIRLDENGLKILEAAALKIRDNPESKVAVIGYGEMSKVANQLSWDRVNSVVNYLIEKEGISQQRIIFLYNQSGGEKNTIDLRSTYDDGPHTARAPHPYLRQRH